MKTGNEKKKSFSFQGNYPYTMTNSPHQFIEKQRVASNENYFQTFGVQRLTL